MEFKILVCVFIFFYDGHKINFHLQFQKPFKTPSFNYLILKAVNDVVCCNIQISTVLDDKISFFSDKK